jgi:hypothetical protein
MDDPRDPPAYLYKVMFKQTASCLHVLEPNGTRRICDRQPHEPERSC